MLLQINDRASTRSGCTKSLVKVNKVYKFYIAIGNIKESEMNVSWSVHLTVPMVSLSTVWPL